MSGGTGGSSGLTKFDELKNLPRSHIGASLVLDRKGPTTFESVNFWKPMAAARAVYGGQILGQALVAATRTVKQSDFKVHSFHAYFLLAGSPELPAIYNVGLTRDGRSFASRSVEATQNGKAIFTAQYSFHADEATPLVHQKPMPEGVPPPEACESRASYLQLLRNKYEAAGDTKKVSFVDRIVASQWPSFPSALDLRYVDGSDSAFFLPLETHAPRPARALHWIKCKHPIRSDAHWIHAAVAAYASDAGIIVPTLFPLGSERYQSSMVTSLDHAMWFHAPFRADDWLLYEIESFRAAAGRGLSQGRIYRRDGTLCITVTQESLLRMKERPGALPAVESTRPAKAKHAKL